MGIRHHRDLDAWRLARDLRREVAAFITTFPAKRDVKFCDQIRESSRSAPSKIAEGFRRFRPREFARFLDIAVGSLGETQNHLDEAFDLRYLSRADFDRIWELAQRAIAASCRLRTYLRRCPPDPFGSPGDKPEQNLEPRTPHLELDFRP
jgi:four helix bundle protein